LNIAGLEHQLYALQLSHTIAKDSNLTPNELPRVYLPVLPELSLWAYTHGISGTSGQSIQDAQ
jgi:hypothetical protein